jgi:hypothetical protein
MQHAPKLSLCSFLLAFLAMPTPGQTFVPGFVERVHGEVLRYHSPLPDVTDALLVRSEDARRSIAWRTAAVPAAEAGDTVTFVWLFGIDCSNPQAHAFALHVNDEPCLTFHNPAGNARRDWTVTGGNGASLRFRATMVDRFGDLMGFATLRLPRARLTPGAGVTLSVVGESAGRPTWYMTFQDRTAPRAALAALPALRRGPDGPFRPLLLSVVHLGEPVAAEVGTSWAGTRSMALQLGGNEFEFAHPEVAAPTAACVTLRIAGRIVHEVATTIGPVRPWWIDLVQHTHSDIGYTRPQTEILPEHLRFLDTALELCTATDELPDDARFRWTCETSWAVREYLRHRTQAQIAELVRRVREGRIEVTGMYLNLSDTIDEASMAAFLWPIRELRSSGLPVRTLMQDDINGAGWCLPDYALDLGVDCLVMGQHGHRALVPFAVPTLFWWAAPSGRRLLAFRADHYMTGNFFGVHTGSRDAVEPALLRYLTQLAANGYPHDRVSVQHSGYATDNAPPSRAACGLVAAWNERFVWPRLRCALASDMPRAIAATHGDALPVLRAAWPDWWSDGFGASPRESAAARQTQSALLATESLLAFERLAGLLVTGAVRRELELARDALLFYGEHTFGAAESVREPFAENTQVQWGEKAAYAWDAMKRAAIAGEGALGALPALLPPALQPRLVLWNGLGHARSGLVELYADHELLPIDRPFCIVGTGGREVQAQLLRSRTEGSYWALDAGELPPFALCTFDVEVGAAAGGRARDEAAGTVLENAHYRVVVDAATGGIASLCDKALGCELVDAAAGWRLGQVLHERLGNRAQLEAFQLTDNTRTALRDVTVGPLRRGAVFDAIAVTGGLPGCEGADGVRCELRLFHGQKRLELHYLAKKRREFAPEAIYVALPFALPGAEVLFETLGGVASPAAGEIIPGTASDWQSIQNVVAVRGDGVQVVVASDEIPLVQLGGLNLGRFQRVMRVERPHVYSWVMNNYWGTNFHAGPEGDFRWHYAITSAADRSRHAAVRFGCDARVPVLARLLRGGGGGGAATMLPALPALPANVLLVAARPARSGDGVVLHLREVDGEVVRVDLRGLEFAGRPARVRRVSVIEEPLGDVSEVLDALVLGPFATAFVLLTAPE